MAAADGSPEAEPEVLVTVREAPQLVGVTPDTVGAFCRAFEHATEQLHFRSVSDIARFFDGLELMPPSALEQAGRICYAGDWGAEDPVLADSDGSRWLVCGVGRVPGPGAVGFPGRSGS